MSRITMFLKSALIGTLMLPLSGHHNVVKKAEQVQTRLLAQKGKAIRNRIAIFNSLLDKMRKDTNYFPMLKNQRSRNRLLCELDGQLCAIEGNKITPEEYNHYSVVLAAFTIKQYRLFKETHDLSYAQAYLAGCWKYIELMPYGPWFDPFTGHTKLIEDEIREVRRRNQMKKT